MQMQVPMMLLHVIFAFVRLSCVGKFAAEHCHATRTSGLQFVDKAFSEHVVWRACGIWVAGTCLGSQTCRALVFHMNSHRVCFGCISNEILQGFVHDSIHIVMASSTTLGAP